MLPNTVGRRNWRLPWKYPNRNGYSVVESQDIAISPIHVKKSIMLSWSLSQALLTIFFCTASFFAGFKTSQYLERTQRVVQPNIQIVREPARTLIKQFHYNTSFSAAPSKDSNRAWKENLPAGQGFMTDHSTLSNISEFSVFHQLHCIDVLRHAYYSALSEQEVLDEGKETKNAHHVTHCFDFLRQCVECSADTNIEPVDWSLGGVSGWGFARVCMDFEAVKRYVEKWKVPGIE